MPLLRLEALLQGAPDHCQDPEGGIGTPSATARLVFDFGSPEAAQAVRAALAPEMADGPGGTRIVLACVGAQVQVDLSSSTASHLRAALNSLLRLAAVAQAGVA